MSIYSDKLRHVQVVINCLNSVAQLCTNKDTLAHILGVPSTDDIMSYDSFTIVMICIPNNLVFKWLENVRLAYGLVFEWRLISGPFEHLKIWFLYAT